MRFVPGMKIILCLLLPYIFPLPAQAIPAITCHCFTERSYDAAHPAAADSYFLATTQNSFFAIVFNTDKKSVVMKKQQGTSSDDLWIASWVAARSGMSPESLLQAKQDKEAWGDVIVPLRLSTKDLGASFYAAMTTKASTAHLAETAVDELFLRNQILSERELVALRQAGASSQELILATVIASKTKEPAKKLYLEVKTGTKTWGSLLSSAKIDTKNMQQEISRILKLPSQ